MKDLVTKRLILLAIPLLRLVASQSQVISGVINGYYQVNAITVATNTLSLNTTSGLSPGTKVLIIEMKGATIDGSNSAGFGNITGINEAGAYEFNYVCSVSGNNVILKYQLVNTYDPTQQVQLVSIPVYTSVSVTGTLSANPWDPIAGTGGVVAIEATDTIYLNANVDVTGAGYQGGPLVNYPVPPYNCSWAVTVNNYFTSVPPSDAFHTGGKKGEGVAYYILNEEYGMGKQANGGGGGNNNNAGGAGGGNFGAGGNGGTRTMETFFDCHGMFPGIGGLSLAAYGYSLANNRLFLGGGGGSGHENNGVGLPGGNGGGMVVITAPVVVSSGDSILANGLSPINASNTPDTAAQGDGGGGGGAGGTVVLNASQIVGPLVVETMGARGSDASYAINDCTGPGGGGGGGVLWTSGAAVPPTITPLVNGGSNGLVSMTSLTVACRGASNSATSGANGASQSGYVAPMGTSPVCTILAAGGLRYFKGTLTNQGALLAWQIDPTSFISSFDLESSIDQISYLAVAEMNANGLTNFTYPDNKVVDGTVYYRLKIVGLNGSTSYSNIVALTRNTKQPAYFSIQPNPVTSALTLGYIANGATRASLVLFDDYGQRIYTGIWDLVTGYNTKQLAVSQLAGGVYIILLQTDATQQIQRFIKLSQP